MVYTMIYAQSKIQPLHETQVNKIRVKRVKPVYLYKYQYAGEAISNKSCFCCDFKENTSPIKNSLETLQVHRINL